MSNINFLESCDKGNEIEIINNYNLIKSDQNIIILIHEGFVRSCKLGDLKLIKWFLDLKKTALFGLTTLFNITYISNKHNSIILTAFNTACVHNNITVVKYLIDKFDINIEHENAYNLFKMCCYNNSLESINWLLSRYDTKLINKNLILNCCKKDILEVIILFSTLHNFKDNITEYFNEACKNNSVNVAIWIYNKYSNEYQFDLIDIFNELFSECNSFQILQWIYSTCNINISEYVNSDTIKTIIDKNNKIKIIWILNLDNSFCIDEHIDVLLKYACCMCNDHNLATLLITHTKNRNVINIDDLFFYTCCSGNYECANWIHTNFPINIRKHNDVEFVVICQKLLYDVNDKNYLNILDDYSNINKNYICDNTNSEHNLYKTLNFLVNLCSDYSISLKNEELVTFKLTTIFDKAYKSYDSGNISRAIDILGIKKIKQDNFDTISCLCCLDVCEYLIETNCKHYICASKIIEWLKNKKIYSCPMCSQMIVFKNCSIIN